MFEQNEHQQFVLHSIIIEQYSTKSIFVHSGTQN